MTGKNDGRTGCDYDTCAIAFCVGGARRLGVAMRDMPDLMDMLDKYAQSAWPAVCPPVESSTKTTWLSC
jgi:hypothetical protein